MKVKNFNCFQGNVAVGSATQNWGFTIPQFAKVEIFPPNLTFQLYAVKFESSLTKMCDILANRYYDPDGRKDTQKPISNGTKLKPAFLKLVLEPIAIILQVISQFYSKFVGLHPR